MRNRSRFFWLLVGVTALGAVLRFATLGAQSYHHDEIVTASRVLRVGFGHAMDAVGFSESAPPLYYVLAWLWTQVAGTGEWGLRSLSAVAGVATIPVAYLVGRELRGERVGLLAAALVAVNPMLLWYSQEARAYSLLCFFCALALLYCVRAMQRSGEGKRDEKRDFVAWGVFSALAMATHYFAVFPLIAEVVLLWRRRGQAIAPGLWIVGLTAAVLAPLAYHQMSYGHAEWIGKFSLGHRLGEIAISFLVGETGDIIGRVETPGPALVPLALVIAAFVLLAMRGSRDEKRAAAIPLAVGATAIAVPLLLALGPGGKDFVLARNLLPALVPFILAAAVAFGVRRAPRLGTGLAVALLAYSFGFCVWVSASPDLQRPDWKAVANHLGEPDGPRATVTWVIGEAPLRYYLEDGATQSKPSEGAIQLKASEGYDWLVREVNFVSLGQAPPPPHRLLGPRLREIAYEKVGELYIRRYRAPGPELVPLRLRSLRNAETNFRNNGVLLDGIGPG